jgi:hypothetical protein
MFEQAKSGNPGGPRWLDAMSQRGLNAGIEPTLSAAMDFALRSRALVDYEAVTAEVIHRHRSARFFPSRSTPRACPKPVDKPVETVDSRETARTLLSRRDTASTLERAACA